MTNPREHYFSYYCEKCNQIKRLISLYGLPRTFEILENVLVRKPEQQELKINQELKKEAEILDDKKKLRNGKNI